MRIETVECDPGRDRYVANVQRFMRRDRIYFLCLLGPENLHGWRDQVTGRRADDVLSRALGEKMLVQRWERLGAEGFGIEEAQKAASAAAE